MWHGTRRIPHRAARECSKPRFGGLYLWSLMASLATLISNSRTLGKPRSPAAGLSAWKSTKLLDVGMHPNVQVSVQGQLVFQAQLSKTFYLCTLKCIDIMCNTQYVDIIIKGEQKIANFKSELSNISNECTEIEVGGSVEILRDSCKTPVIHAVYVNHLSLETCEHYVYSDSNEQLESNQPQESTKLPCKETSEGSTPYPKSQIVVKQTFRRRNLNSHWKPKKNERRAAKFVNFLVDEFGYDYLKNGIILDIAGGKGEVAFECSILRGLRTIVLDPRPVKTTKKQLRQLKFRLEAQLKVGKGLQVSPLCRFLYHKRYAARAIDSIQTWFYEDFATLKTEEIELVQNASILVGLHPDSATDAIMKVAIRYCKPFAIVPCCVFPTQFPKRRLPNGGPVQTYDDLCEYIRNILGTKNGKTKVEEGELDFDGRNKVFFYHGPRGT